MLSNDVTTNGSTADKGPLPEAVYVSNSARFTPNQLRQLRAVSGIGLEQVMGDEANVFQAMIYFKLWRMGYEPSWEACGYVSAILEDEPQDPSSPESVTTSQPSAATGE